MKNPIFFLLLFMTAQIWAQDNMNYQDQKETFELAKKTLAYPDYLTAARLYTFVYAANPNTQIAQIAIKKADSLKSIFRKDKIISLIGNWKWISKDANWAIRDDGLVAKMITITTNEILFYELYRDSKKWDLVKTEKIDFSQNPDSYSFTEFLYSNNEVWEYTINKDSGELTAFYIGEKIEDNYTQLVCGNPVLYYFKLQ